MIVSVVVFNVNNHVTVDFAFDKEDSTLKEVSERIKHLIASGVILPQESVEGLKIDFYGRPYTVNFGLEDRSLMSLRQKEMENILLYAGIRSGGGNDDREDGPNTIVGKK